MTEPMIKTDHLSHTYEDEDGKVVYALKDISLEIGKGEFVAIIGTNGSGKSTLAKHFNVLLTPTSGTCEVCGMRTDDPDNIWKIRQHVGMVFQNPDNQIVAAVVEEDVAFGPENLGVPSDEIKTRVSDALRRVNDEKRTLAGRERRYPGHAVRLHRPRRTDGHARPCRPQGSHGYAPPAP